MDAEPISLDLWLVNDDPAQLMVQKRLLSRVATVQGFLSPLEAVAAARSGNSSRFLITDFHMPDMDGPDLARTWCDLHSDARVLLVSASEVTRQEREKVEALPPQVRLLTSYRITELQEQARSWFSQQEESPVEMIALATVEGRLDPTVLEKLATLGGPTFVSKTVERFLQNGPEKVRGVAAAHAEQDYERMHQLAHALKGSCGVVGATALCAAADQIEIATGCEGDTGTLDSLVRLLQEECDAAVELLEKHRA